MVEYIETGDHVFRAEVTPDTSGYCRRTLCISVESGPPLTDEQYDALVLRVVAELLSAGVDVIGWEVVDEDAEG